MVHVGSLNRGIKDLMSHGDLDISEDTL